MGALGFLGLLLVLGFFLDQFLDLFLRGLHGLQGVGLLEFFLGDLGFDLVERLLQVVRGFLLFFDGRVVVRLVLRVEFVLGLFHFGLGVLDVLGGFLRDILGELLRLLRLELDAGLLGGQITGVLVERFLPRLAEVTLRRRFGFLLEFLLVGQRFFDLRPGILEALQLVLGGAQGHGQFQQVLGGGRLVRVGGVRFVAAQVLGGEQLNVEDLLALFANLRGGQAGFLFVVQQRREFFHQLEERLEIPLQIALTVGLISRAFDDAASARAALALLDGQRAGQQHHLILFLAGPFQPLGRLVERLDGVVLQEQSLEALHHVAVLVVGLFGLDGGGFLVGGLDGGFEVGDHRLHLGLREFVQRAGGLGEQLLLLALVQAMVGHEAEHRAQALGDLVGLGLDPALLFRRRGGRPVRFGGRDFFIGPGGQHEQGSAQQGGAPGGVTTDSEHADSSGTPGLGGGADWRARTSSGKSFRRERAVGEANTQPSHYSTTFRRMQELPWATTRNSELGSRNWPR